MQVEQYRNVLDPKNKLVEERGRELERKGAGKGRALERGGR
jgi:hypothetical protein